MGAVQLQSNPEGRAKVTLVSPTVVEIAYEGYASREVNDRSLAEVDAIFEANPKANSVLWNTIALTGYEPGNTAAAMKWMVRQVQLRRSATVTRSQSLASLSHITRVMVTGVEVQSFRLRAEAMEWLGTPLTGRARTRSGRYRKMA